MGLPHLTRNIITTFFVALIVYSWYKAECDLLISSVILHVIQIGGEWAKAMWRSIFAGSLNFLKV